jgi:hypothetical protein
VPRLFVEPVAQGSPKPAQEFLPHATANAAREPRFPEKQFQAGTRPLETTLFNNEEEHPS